MLKRIRRHQISAGMFIADLEEPKRQREATACNFLVKDDAHALKVKSSNVMSIVIDTHKGADLNGKIAHPLAQVPAASLQLGGFSDEDLKEATQTVEGTRSVVENLFSDIRRSGVATYRHAELAVEQIARSIENNPAALISITRLKSKDEYSFLHSISVSALMMHFARFLGFDTQAVRLLGIGGLLHDIGKLVMPNAILANTGPLTNEEMAQIRLHPVRGHELLKHECEMQLSVLDICLHHHERLDGKGYPYGLTDKQVSLEARIAAICDVYDAMTSVRPYKRAFSPAETVKLMLKSDGHFDPYLLGRFIDSLRWKGKTKRANEHGDFAGMVSNLG